MSLERLDLFNVILIRKLQIKFDVHTLSHCNSVILCINFYIRFLNQLETEIYNSASPIWRDDFATSGVRPGSDLGVGSPMGSNIAPSPSAMGPSSVGPASVGPASVGLFGPGSVGPSSVGPGSVGPGSVGRGKSCSPYYGHMTIMWLM